MFKSSREFVWFYDPANKTWGLDLFHIDSSFPYCFFNVFLIRCSSHKCCCWSSEIFPLKKKNHYHFYSLTRLLCLLHRAPVGTGRMSWMSSMAGPPLREHRDARVHEHVRVCRKGMREGENVCVPSLIRKFNWMEFGSFFLPPRL